VAGHVTAEALAGMGGEGSEARWMAPSRAGGLVLVDRDAYGATDRIPVPGDLHGGFFIAPVPFLTNLEQGHS
jgi:hypothetical protein